MAGSASAETPGRSAYVEQQGGRVEAVSKKGPFGLFYGWWMVAAAASIQFLAGGFYGVGFSVYFLPITRDLGLSRAAISLAFSLRSLEGGLDAPVVGHLVDRFGPRFMMRAGAVLAGVGFISLAFVRDYTSFIIVFLGLVVLGINSGVAMPGSTLVNHWFARQRTMAITLSHLGAEIGGTILTPLIALVVLNVGWREAAVVSGVAFLIIVPLLSLVVRNTPESMGLRPDGAPRQPESDTPIGNAPGTHPASAGNGDFTVREALKTRTFWQLALAIGARQFAKQALMVHLIPILVWRGFDEQTSAVLLGLFAFSQIPLRIVAARVADTWSMTKLPALSGLAGVATVSVLLFVDSPWIGIGVLFALLFALAEAGNSAGWSVIGEFFGREKYGTIRGAISMVHSAIALPSPVIAGWVYDTTQSYELALMPLAGFYFCSFLLYWAMARPRLTIAGSTAVLESETAPTA